MEATTFGRYRLIELLGRGGMGEVWRAHDSETDRIVAVKVLTAHLSEDDDFQRRFRREAHAAGRLNSPHVIPIHTYGEIDGRLYVDMRLIEGRDLAAVLADGPLEPARAVHIVEQVAKALHAAHQVGLMHRDIKPSNILLGDDDFAYLIDFGIARAVDETRMTKSGNTIGTFAYIAPERLDPQADEDARTDIYSLACVLYEALTGEPPFPGNTAAHLIAAHLNTPPPRPSARQQGLPPTVDEVIATGMAKDPARRYATTIELANAARDAITEPIPRPTPSPMSHIATQKAPPPLSKRPPHVTPPAQTGGGGIARRTAVALTVGAAILVIVVAIGLYASFGTPHSRAPQSPTAQPNPNTSQPVPTSSKASVATSARAPSTDYSGLLIPATDINAPVTFMSRRTINNPNGQPGVATTFSDEDRSHVIKDTIQVFSDAAAASNALDAAEGAQGNTIKDPTSRPAGIGTGGTTLSGNSPDGSKGVTVMLFTQGRALVTLEFDGPPDSLAPVDFVTDVGQKQDAAVKTGLGG